MAKLTGGASGHKWDYVQDSQPADEDLGETWLKTSVTPPETYVGDGNGNWYLQTTDKHDELGNVQPDQHHAKPSGRSGLNLDTTDNAYDVITVNALIIDENGQVAVDESQVSHDNLSNVSEGDHRTTERVEDIVGSLIGAQGNISVSYDDGADALTIDTSALNEEEVEDAVSSLLTTDSNLTLSYDDGSDSLTVGLADSISVSSANIGVIGGSGSPYSIADDGSDLTQYTVSRETSNTDLINVSQSGVWHGGQVAKRNRPDGAYAADIVVDGGSSFTVDWFETDINNAAQHSFAMLPPIRFDSSLRITLRPDDDEVSGTGWATL